MSTMKSIRLAFDCYRDGQDDDHDSGPPLWGIAIFTVIALVVVVGLANLGMLPSFAADDAGSILFSGG